MKWVKLGVLITFLCMPIFVLFAYDDSYNSLQDDLCYQHPIFYEACQSSSDRYEQAGLISRNFYRHINHYLGRKTSDTPAFIELVRNQTDNVRNSEPRTQKIEQSLTSFNRSFIIAVNCSIAVAGAALTLLIQKSIAYARRRRTRSSKNFSRQAASPHIVTPTITHTRTKPVRPRRTTASRSPTPRKRSAKRPASVPKPRKPDTVRPKRTSKK
jgi:hypothetical protein